VSSWAVILAGGVGSRFWPLSTPSRPKQLLPLLSGQSLLRSTFDRVKRIAPADRTLVLTNAGVASAVARDVPELPAGHVIAEPKPAGTAAALAWAATEIARRGGERDVMVCVHADWAIPDADAFARALSKAAEVARKTQALVTIGIVPTRDDPGFGYIVPGEEHPSGARKVARFVEKPSRKRAAELRRDGALWNSGIFAWRVDVFLRELAKHTREIAPALATDSRETKRAENFFASVEPISIDVGLLERTANVLVLSGDFSWDDIGTWGALLRAGTPDPSGNVTHGNAYVLESKRNVVHSEGDVVVLYGVQDLVVVARDGLTLVTSVERSNDLKALLESLPPEVRGPT
jgi:mannose-1-phosphate guanylyltransferase